MRVYAYVRVTLTGHRCGLSADRCANPLRDHGQQGAGLYGHGGQRSRLLGIGGGVNAVAGLDVGQRLVEAVEGLLKFVQGQAGLRETVMADNQAVLDDEERVFVEFEQLVFAIRTEVVVGAQAVRGRGRRLRGRGRRSRARDYELSSEKHLEKFSLDLKCF